MGRLTVAVIVSMWVVPISIIVNHIVPEPYMDEIFHVPQAQQYCNGNFRSWDPMITTPPGLYFLSLAYVASLFPGFSIIQRMSLFSEACSTAILRFTNGILVVLCSIIVFEIITFLKPVLSDRKATFMAVVLSLYPLHWFFTFLYYTDVASLTAVLAAYLACLKKKYQYSALFGALAVLIRQTNIIWMLFVACTGVIDMVDTHRKDGPNVYESTTETSMSNPKNTVAISAKLRKRKSNDCIDMNKHSRPNTITSSTTHDSDLVNEIQDLLSSSWRMKLDLLVSFSPFIVVLISFVAFVYWNGSIVLGAKEAHAVSLHFAQIMYFSLVSALATAPLHFTIPRARDLFEIFWKNRPRSFLLGLVALVASFLSVQFFSIAHPYLLADNRHYPFYLWRKVIKAHYSMKFLLIPLYVYSWFSMINLLGRTRNKIWVLVYFLATIAVLVPTPLIEFRYYTIPFYLLVLHSDIRDYRRWFLIAIIYLVVNVFTMMMFLFRPFRWDHEAGIQRFIW